MRRLCVFCGSSVGSSAKHADGARRLGEALVARGLDLVYGAGHVGLMGVLADAVLNAGGELVQRGRDRFDQGSRVYLQRYRRVR